MSSSEAPRRRLLDRAQGAPTLLGAGGRIVGRLEAVGPVAIAGHVVGDGEIRGVLSIAAGAHWEGDVRAQAAVVAGRVTGDLAVEETLEIGRAAVVRGNVRARFVAIAHGALVDGGIEVTGDRPIVRFEERRVSRLADATPGEEPAAGHADGP